MMFVISVKVLVALLFHKLRRRVICAMVQEKKTIKIVQLVTGLVMTINQFN